VPAATAATGSSDETPKPRTGRSVGTILGIDTATRFTSVASLGPDDRVVERTEIASGGHAAELPRLVQETLDAAGVRLPDVDDVAVSIGPGSFTGLRVGLALAKGLVFAGRQGIVGVSTLQALATVAPPGPGFVAACLDARKGEVYLGMYRRDDEHTYPVIQEVALRPEEAIDLIEENLHRTDGVVVGDAAERYPEAFAPLRVRGLRVLSFDEVHPSGIAVARLGRELLEAGPASPPEGLLPRYLRASEAEARFGGTTLTRRKTL
jgi:tRNA threonylcarbamoyladenosine biosynthesis protein TsaB